MLSIFLILYFVLQLFFRYFSQFPGYSHIFPVMNHFIICRIFRLACLPPWQYSASRFYCFAAQHFFCSDIFRVHILLSPVNYYNLYIYHLESSIFLSLLFRWSSGLFFHLFCLAHLFFPASLRLLITLPSRSNPAHHSSLALPSCSSLFPSALILPHHSPILAHLFCLHLSACLSLFSSLAFPIDSSFITTIRLAFVSSCPIVFLASALHFLPFSPTGSYFMPTL